MRGVKKENFPTKVCVVCERPFTWRKKWATVWDEVTTCSKSCNAKRRAAKRQGANEADRGSDELLMPHDGSSHREPEEQATNTTTKAQQAERRV